MMYEIKDPSVTVYEVYIVCVILLLFVCVYFFLSSCRVVSKMSISVHKIIMCWCFLIGLAEIISTPLTDLHH